MVKREDLYRWGVPNISEPEREMAVFLIVSGIALGICKGR